MSDPTDEEMLTFVNCGVVLDWCGVAALEAGPQTERRSLLVLLGATEAAHPRLLGMLPEADFLAVLQTWAPGGAAPSALQIGMGRTFGRVCRLVAGTQYTVAQAQAQQAAAQTLATLQAQAAIAGGPAAAAPAATGFKIKLNQVYQQTADGGTAVLDATGLAPAFKNCETVFEGQPAPQEEASPDQLSVFKHMLGEGGNPFAVDFALFGPFSIRAMRKLKLRGTCRTRMGGFSGSSSRAHPPSRGGTRTTASR